MTPSHPAKPRCIDCQTKVYRLPWAKLLARVFREQVLVCPSCQARGRSSPPSPTSTSHRRSSSTSACPPNSPSSTQLAHRPSSSSRNFSTATNDPTDSSLCLNSNPLLAGPPTYRLGTLPSAPRWLTRIPYSIPRLRHQNLPLHNAAAPNAPTRPSPVCEISGSFVLCACAPRARPADHRGRLKTPPPVIFSTAC